MNVTYFKRYKMELDLYDAPAVPALPEGYYWVPWDESLLELHAEVKFRSFQEEIDATVFPSLADRRGCYYLMNEICHKRGFLPLATWLVASAGGYCGTVQGIRERAGLGAIQNLGVTPLHRGRGIGSALLLQALHGFRRCGLGRAFLEVTAQNDSAVQLYRRLGFRCRKTLYRAVESASWPLTADLHQPEEALASRREVLG
jgi:ribosomal protein S18 acetylase RimI-like enzyme